VLSVPSRKHPHLEESIPAEGGGGTVQGGVKVGASGGDGFAESDEVGGEKFDGPAVSVETGGANEEVFRGDFVEIFSAEEFVRQLGGEAVEGSINRFGEGVLPRTDTRVVGPKAVIFSSKWLTLACEEETVGEFLELKEFASGDATWSDELQIEKFALRGHLDMGVLDETGVALQDEDFWGKLEEASVLDDEALPHLGKPGAHDVGTGGSGRGEDE